LRVLPFLVGESLTAIGKDTNIHGLAFLGGIVYFLGSAGTAIVLVIALAVRKWSSRSAGSAAQ
jgi:hypothetical protein